MSKKPENSEKTSVTLEKSKIVKPILGKRKVETTKEEIVKKSKGSGKEVKIVKRKKFKKALRNFPLLMAREVRRIRWVGHQELNKKFWITVAFIVVFAIYFAIFKTLLDLIFKLIK